MPGMMKKGMMYQAGGPVKEPAPRKTPRMEGGRKQTMFEQVSPEEQREAGAPLTREEMRRIIEGQRETPSRMKKGGKVMAKAPAMKKGGVVKKAKGGMIGSGCK
jgi:hypothetical protein